MKKSLKKLVLNRETMRNLGDPELSRIAGQYPRSGMSECADCGSVGCNTQYSCYSCFPWQGYTCG
jgi:hypothetical protein